MVDTSNNEKSWTGITIGNWMWQGQAPAKPEPVP